MIPAYMGLIRQIDDQLGGCSPSWRARASTNTMIVFTSDHGDYLGDHWLGEKDLFHDASVKVPLIVVDPSPEADATRGTACDALVEAIDLAPTFIEYFGGTPPRHVVEGRSLCRCCAASAGAMARPTCSPSTTTRCWTSAPTLGVPTDKCRLFMVFDGRWKYIHAPGFRPMLYRSPVRSVRSLSTAAATPAWPTCARGCARRCSTGRSPERPHHHDQRTNRRLRAEPVDQVKRGF